MLFNSCFKINDNIQVLGNNCLIAGHSLRFQPETQNLELPCTA